MTVAVSDYDTVIATAQAFGKLKHPHAPDEHHVLFARAVAYLVTGYCRNFADRPAGREKECLAEVNARSDIGGIAVEKACRALVRGAAYTSNVTVYRYGTPRPGSNPWCPGCREGKPRNDHDHDPNIPDVIMQQILLAHRLRNALVEISRRADDERNAVDAMFPDVAAKLAELAEAETAVAEAKAAHAKAKAVHRTKSPKTPEGTALREARERAREIRAELKSAKAIIKEQAQPLKQEIAERQKASIAALYPVYSELGVYWAVINDVTHHHRIAEQAIVRLRLQGRPAAFRFKRYTGTGALAVQPQRQAGMPPRTPQLLASGQGKWRNVIQLGTWVPPNDFRRLTRPQQKTLAESAISLRVGDEFVEVPSVLHRMLPEDADVTGARLVLYRVGPDTRVSVSITAKVPDPAPRTAGPTVAIHCGWRREPNDDIRVATWRSTEPITVPDAIRDVLRVDTPTAGIVVLPADWRAGLARPDEIRSQRDQLLDPVRTALADWLQQHPQQHEGEPTAVDVQKWRSPGRFTALSARWKDNPPVDSADIITTLETWRHADLLLWRKQERGRASAIDRRKDGYRRVAAWLANTAGRIVVDDTDLAALTRTIKNKDAEDPTPKPTAITQVAARQRVDAAPGDLRAFVVAAGKREGVPVDTVSALNLSREHTCGHLNDEPTTRPILCRGCGREYDPDLSATMLMLLRSPL